MLYVSFCDISDLLGRCLKKIFFLHFFVFKEKQVCSLVNLSLFGFFFFLKFGL